LEEEGREGGVSLWNKNLLLVKTSGKLSIRCAAQKGKPKKKKKKKKPAGRRGGEPSSDKGKSLF